MDEVVKAFPLKAFAAQGNNVAARDILTEAGLRVTQQRIALTKLFCQDERHVSVDDIYGDLMRQGAPGSLGSVDRSLPGFSEVDLLRRVLICGSTDYFDTMLEYHHHFTTWTVTSCLTYHSMPFGQRITPRRPMATNW
ncbi:Fur family transcriptional regulator [Phyllobacterium salinisoli]|uniref:Fur family transcriptional regulator n=1 Tax=Phyllobacterium salinisoli TaxID=1899321 RepID=UPI001358D43C|nr:transcriptional repressor [Phyllobacterium salinisoli]